MRYWLEIIGNALVMIFGLWSLLMFIQILTNGRVIFIEPNVPILVTETIMSGIIIFIGAERLYDDLKEPVVKVAKKLGGVFHAIL